MQRAVFALPNISRANIIRQLNNRKIKKYPRFQLGKKSRIFISCVQS
jgi:chloramphenicol O-acetyltransferase